MSDPIKVLAFDRSAGLSLAEDAIDLEAGIIRGISIATAGVEAIGHGDYDEETGELLRELWTDADTLKDMLAACLAVGEPLKGKLEHGSGLSAVVGTFDNFRIEDNAFRADFTALTMSEQVQHLFNLAKRIPRQFGVSVTAYLRKVAKGAIDVMRCDEILSADFVDEPAINAALFSRKNRVDKLNTVSKKQLQMTPEEIKELVTECMAPITDRLTKLEDGMKPDEEKLSADEAAKEEMSKKIEAQASTIEAQSTELAAQKAALTELTTKVEEATRLGIERGAQHQDADKEKSFEGELSKLTKDGKPRHIAFGELCAKEPALVAAEARKQGKKTWELV